MNPKLKETLTYIPIIGGFFQKRPDGPLSRRDFLKVAAIAAGTLTACGVEGDVYSQQEAGDDPFKNLSWSDSPFRNFERAIDLNDAEIIDSFGGEGKSYRVVSVKPEKLFPETMNSWLGAPQEIFAARIDTLLSKYSEILLFQEKTDTGWADVDFPGTVLFGNLSRIITSSDIFNKDAKTQKHPEKVYSELFEALLNPDTEPQKSTEIVDKWLTSQGKENIELLEWWMTANHANLKNIPECVTPDTLMKLYLASYLHPNTDDSILLEEVAKRSGSLHAVFVPNLPEELKGAVELYKEGFAKIADKPRVFYAVVNDDWGGTTKKMLVMHNEGNPSYFYNYDYIAPKDQDGRTYEKEEISDAGNWRTLPEAETEEIRKFFGLAKQKWLGAKMLEMHELSPDAIGHALIPNKTVGLLKSRNAPAVFFKTLEGEGSTSATRVLLFEEKLRDMLVPEQLQIQPFDNFITNVTEKIENFRKKGIKHIFSMGALSPLEALSRALKGMRDPYNLGSHLALLPDNPYLLTVLADLYMQTVLTDRYNKQTNLAVSLTNLPMYIVKATDFKELPEELGYTDTSTMERCVIDGEEVNLEAGAVFPVSEIRNIAGKNYIFFKINKDDDGKFFQEVWNNNVVDKIPAALAIPIEAALDGGVLMLDPDNNILDAIKTVAKIAAISAAVISFVVFPEAAGAAIVVSGMAVQKKLLEVLAGLGASIIK